MWISRNCNSDNLKWYLVQSLGGTASTLRVHDGFNGLPFDRFTPLLNGPPGGNPAEANKGPLVIVQSFGP